jgi:hypothetical protein
LYIKQEIMESEGAGGVEAMDQDDDDIVLENVVTGGKLDPERGESESESSESVEDEGDERMEDRLDDPISAVRTLFEMEECVARAGVFIDKEGPTPVIKPALDNTQCGVYGGKRVMGRTGRRLVWLRLRRTRVFDAGRRPDTLQQQQLQPGESKECFKKFRHGGQLCDVPIGSTQCPGREGWQAGRLLSG